MRPVFQTCVDSGFGDCQRAAVATLFDLDITQVPNFILFSDQIWFSVYFYFIYALGYDFVGTGYPDKPALKLTGEIPEPTINGYVEAVVPSRTFKDKQHAVIIDKKGLVVHDPNPNQLWKGVNVIESGDLVSWAMVERRKDK